MLLRDIIEKNKLSRKTAVIYKDIHYTYENLYDDCVDVSKQLLFCEGNVGIFLPNSYDYVVTFFSVSFAGKIVAPISINSTASEINKALSYCDISVIVTNSIYFELLKKHVNDLDIYDVYLIDRKEFIKGNTLNKTENIPSIVNEDSLFLLVHTSGSVSHPKRVMLSHKNLISNAYSIVESLELTPDEITLIVLPLFLISAITSQMVAHMLIGATIVILELPFMVNNFLNECEKHSVTNLTCVPTVLNLVTLRDPIIKKFATLRKICFGGAPTPKQKIVNLIERFPAMNFIHMYGQTEASARLTHLLPKDFKEHIGSVGKAIPKVNLRIEDDNGTICQPMVIGEVCAKGDNIMLGYYKNPDSTKITLINGWLHTGDLGYFDYSGFLYIVGRKKNIIISKGINIYPEEIEEVLLSHKNISEAVVYGIKDEILGEVVCAKIVLIANMNESDIIEYCSQILSSYKVPKKIIFCNNIDKTATGKIRRVNNE